MRPAALRQQFLFGQRQHALPDRKYVILRNIKNV